MLKLNLTVDVSHQQNTWQIYKEGREKETNVEVLQNNLMQHEKICLRNKYSAKKHTTKEVGESGLKTCVIALLRIEDDNYVLCKQAKLMKLRMKQNVAETQSLLNVHINYVWKQYNKFTCGFKEN